MSLITSLAARWFDDGQAEAEAEEARPRDVPTLSILNCHDGDTRIPVDPDDPEGLERVKIVVDQMLRMGYTILVEEADGAVRRVEAFDPVAAAYIIQDRQAMAPKAGGRKAKAKAEAKTKGKGKGKRGTRALPVRGTRATAVAPTAGG